MLSPAPLPLLRVATTWALPGLGLLAVPDGPTPHLAGLPLHTALAIEIRRPDGTRQPAVATVEEMSRTGADAVRGLLLDVSPDQALLPGTIIWLSGLAPTMW